MAKETIGCRLRKLRQSVKISQRKMGELLGLSQSAIDRYERDLSCPNAENFVVYADYFDVSLDYIFGRCDEPQGKLYEHRPHIEQVNPDLKSFVHNRYGDGLAGTGKQRTPSFAETTGGCRTRHHEYAQRNSDGYYQRLHQAATG